MTDQTELLTMKELSAALGVSRWTIYAWTECRSLAFPKGIRLGQRSRRWRRSEVDAWIAKRAQESQAE